MISLFANAQKTIKLFNQKNLKAWYAYELETGKHINAAELFSVEQGMIRLYGKKAGYLISEKSFKFFWFYDPYFKENIVEMVEVIISSNKF